MGANGSFSRGVLESESGRTYETIFMIGDNIAVLERKDKRLGVKLPEESHTPGRTYATFRSDGKDVKSIAKYDSNGKKIWEIHTNEHEKISPHFHYWKENGQEKEAHALTAEMKIILNRVRQFK